MIDYDWVMLSGLPNSNCQDLELLVEFGFQHICENNYVQMFDQTRRQYHAEKSSDCWCCREQGSNTIPKLRTIVLAVTLFTRATTFQRFAFKSRSHRLYLPKITGSGAM